jgi:hypothetical protein
MVLIVLLCEGKGENKSFPRVIVPHPIKTLGKESKNLPPNPTFFPDAHPYTPTITHPHTTPHTHIHTQNTLSTFLAMKSNVRKYYSVKSSLRLKGL